MPENKPTEPNPTCILCGNPCETKYGNDPLPLVNHGRCCNQCNESVVEARLKGLTLADFNGEKEPDVDPNSWEGKARRILVGRRIVDVGWMAESEAETLGWRRRAIIIQLDDGTFLYPMRDDEGNDAGALGTTNSIAQTLPVFH